MKGQHPCAVPRCVMLIPTGRLMCGGHWSEVPRSLQQAVYHTWSAVQARAAGAVAKYRAARQQAIDAVSLKETRQTAFDAFTRGRA